MKAFALLLVPALALLAGCSKSESTAAASAANLPVIPVTVARVTAVDAPLLTAVSGTIRPAQRAQLAAKVMGTISELPITLGQRVNQGDLLAKISAPEISARVAQAQAQFNATQRDLTRERALLAKGASTTDLVRGIEDRFTQMEAMVREAETVVSYTELRAPFAGVIARRFVNAGDLAAPAQPLLELEGTANFQIEAGIPDSLIANLSLGQPLAVEGAGNFPAAIVELSSSSDAQARTVTIKLAVPADAAVRSGQFVRVQVPAGQARVLLVPASAITSSGQMLRVFIVENGRATLRLVKTGATRGDQIEILAGLDAGETVIVSPPPSLREGLSVEVRS